MVILNYMTIRFDTKTPNRHCESASRRMKQSLFH